MTRSPPLYRSFASFPNRLSLDIARTQPIASFKWRQVSPAHPPTAFRHPHSAALPLVAHHVHADRLCLQLRPPKLCQV